MFELNCSEKESASKLLCALSSTKRINMELSGTLWGRQAFAVARLQFLLTIKLSKIDTFRRQLIFMLLTFHYILIAYTVILLEHICYIERIPEVRKLYAASVTFQLFDLPLWFFFFKPKRLSVSPAGYFPALTAVSLDLHASFLAKACLQCRGFLVFNNKLC